MEELDSALLFVSSSLAIGFAILQAYLGGQKAIVYFIPILLVGWIVPFYIGYVRGALTIDCIEERARGWLYLLIGTMLYVFYTIYHLARAGGWASKYLGILFPALSIIGGTAVNATGLYIAEGILSIYKREISNEAKAAFSFTSLSAFLLGFFFAFTVTGVETTNRIAQSAVFLVDLFLLFFCIRSELNARRCVHLAQISPTKRVIRKLPYNTKIFLVGISLTVLGLTLLEASEITALRVETTLVLIFVGTGLIFLSLLTDHVKKLLERVLRLMKSLRARIHT